MRLDHPEQFFSLIETSLVLIASGTFGIFFVLMFFAQIKLRELRQRRKDRTLELFEDFDISIPPSLLDVRRRDIPLDLNDVDSEMMGKIRVYLNSLEHISLGVKFGFYDEDLVADYMKFTLLKSFTLARLFIYDVRKDTGSSQIYSNLEFLATRWDRGGGRSE